MEFPNQWVKGTIPLTSIYPPPSLFRCYACLKGPDWKAGDMPIYVLSYIDSIWYSQGEKIMGFVNKFQIVRDLEYYALQPRLCFLVLLDMNIKPFILELRFLNKMVIIMHIQHVYTRFLWKLIRITALILSKRFSKFNLPNL